MKKIIIEKARKFAQDCRTLSRGISKDEGETARHLYRDTKRHAEVLYYYIFKKFEYKVASEMHEAKDAFDDSIASAELLKNRFCGKYKTKIDWDKTTDDDRERETKDVFEYDVLYGKYTNEDRVYCIDCGVDLKDTTFVKNDGYIYALHIVCDSCSKEKPWNNLKR